MASAHSGSLGEGTAVKRPNNYFDGLQVTGQHKMLFFIIMMAYFFEQMDNWNFGFIAPALLETWNLQVADIGRINSLYFVGMTLGGLCGGLISDLIGRKKTFIFSIVVFSVASVVNGLADNLTVFIVARTITGFGVFCLMVCSQAYIAEMAPAESRGKWQGLIATVGFAAVPFIGAACSKIIGIDSSYWRYIFYFGGVGIVGAIVGLHYLKESPRWLVAQHRQAEAEKVVRDLSGQNIDLSSASAGLAPKVPFSEVLTGMFHKRYIKRTLLLILVFVTTTPAAFLVTNWTATLLKSSAGFSVEDAMWGTTLIAIGVPTGCFLSSLVSDMGGRKIPLAVLCAVGAVFGLLFGNLSSIWPEGLLTFGRGDLYWPLVMTGFILTALCMAIGFTTFSYTAESYPTRMRNTATGAHNALARLSVAGSQLVIPVISINYGLPGTFLAFAVLLVVACAAVLLFGERTGGKSLEEIE